MPQSTNRENGPTQVGVNIRARARRTQIIVPTKQARGLVSSRRQRHHHARTP